MSEETEFETWFQSIRQYTFKQSALAGERLEDHPHWSMGLRSYYHLGWMARSVARQTACHVCGKLTLLACSDCRLNFGAVVYVCRNTACRDYHESKCFGDGSGWKSDLERWEACRKNSATVRP